MSLGKHLNEVNPGDKRRTLAFSLWKRIELAFSIEVANMKIWVGL